MHWWDEQMLAPLFEVNERMLRQVPNIWIRIPPGQRGTEADGAAVKARLARCPFLLVEVGLDEPDRWFIPDRSAPAFFTSDEAMALTQMTFFVAWSMARMNPQAASLAMGFSLHAASRLSQLRMEDLCRAAQAKCDSARPKWADRPHIWRRLSRAAASNAETSEMTQGLRVMQLLFWECVHRREVHAGKRTERIAGGFMAAIDTEPLAS